MYNVLGLLFYVLDFTVKHQHSKKAESETDEQNALNKFVFSVIRAVGFIHLFSHSNT